MIQTSEAIKLFLFVFFISQFALGSELTCSNELLSIESSNYCESTNPEFVSVYAGSGIHSSVDLSATDELFDRTFACTNLVRSCISSCISEKERENFNLGDLNAPNFLLVVASTDASAIDSESFKKCQSAAKSFVSSYQDGCIKLEKNIEKSVNSSELKLTDNYVRQKKICIAMGAEEISGENSDRVLVAASMSRRTGDVTTASIAPDSVTPDDLIHRPQLRPANAESMTGPTVRPTLRERVGDRARRLTDAAARADQGLNISETTAGDTNNGLQSASLGATDGQAIGDPSGGGSWSDGMMSALASAADVAGSVFGNISGGGGAGNSASGIGGGRMNSGSPLNSGNINAARVQINGSQGSPSAPNLNTNSLTALSRRGQANPHLRAERPMIRRQSKGGPPQAGGGPRPQQGGGGPGLPPANARNQGGRAKKKRRYGGETAVTKQAKGFQRGFHGTQTANINQAGTAKDFSDQAKRKKANVDGQVSTVAANAGDGSDQSFAQQRFHREYRDGMRRFVEAEAGSGPTGDSTHLIDLMIAPYRTIIERGEVFLTEDADTQDI